MKKIILAFTMLSAFASAQAFEYEYATLTSKTAYEGTYAPIAAPTAIGTDGTIYQAGLYDDIVVIGDDILEPIATSAFLSAITPSASKPQWTIGIQGAARINAITTASDAIYIVGIFADDITLGSKDLNTKSFTGTALSHNLVNGFVAKYSLDGNLLSAQAIIPHKNANYADYESDLAVNPTAIALFNNKVYVSLNYLGGYSIGSLKKDGNVKSSFGYWDSKCVGVISLSPTDLSSPESIYDLRNAAEVNENGYAPSGICLTADADKLYIAACTAQNTQETLFNTPGKTYTSASADQSTYFISIHAIDANASDKSTSYSVSTDRIYINNVIKNMTVSDGKLYMSGCISTPLFFAPSYVPDLWSDQFTACVSTSDFSVQWANITGAKRDDMSSRNNYYREGTGAALCNGQYYIIGSVNYLCDATGKTSDWTSDYCLGIASDGKALALATKTDAGSKLSFTTSPASTISSIKVNAEGNSTIYNLSGAQLQSAPKGSLYIQNGKKLISK